MELAYFGVSSVAGAVISPLRRWRFSRGVLFFLPLFPPPPDSLLRSLDSAHEDDLPEDRLEAGNWMVRV